MRTDRPCVPHTLGEDVEISSNIITYQSIPIKVCIFTLCGCLRETTSPVYVQLKPTNNDSPRLGMRGLILEIGRFRRLSQEVSSDFALLELNMSTVDVNKSAFVGILGDKEHGEAIFLPS